MSLSRTIIDQTLATPLGTQAYGIVEKLTDAGFDAWWVGGCVRDMLLEKPLKDIDIGTSALPEQVAGMFPKSDVSAAKFGTVRVKKGRILFEITTFREDDEASDGRRPETVVFGTREQDAKRRDITVNAMYWHPISRQLYDPFDGEKDLEERLIRFVGDPAMRIKHDKLRIIRVVRFRALLEGQYHPETYAALREHAADIEILSGTRVFDELEKILSSPHPDRALEDLWELAILRYILPELYDCKGVPQPADFHREGDVWDHLLACTRAFREDDGPDVRLAALFHDIGKVQTFSLKERIRFNQHASVSGEITEKALSRLQCPAKRREKIVWLVKHHMMMEDLLEMTEERKAHWYFHPWFSDLVRLFYLDIAGTEPAEFQLYEKILADYHAFLDRHPSPQKPLLSGDEIMELLGLTQGERVGDAITLLHDAQVRGEVTGKAEAKGFLSRHFR